MQEVDDNAKFGEVIARFESPDVVMRWLGRVSYERGLSLQEELLELRRSNEIADTVLLLEHDPVYTIGRTRDRSSLVSEDALPHPVVEINRGGQATYHGPGQLVGYPILNLQHFGKDLHVYLRCLEEALIQTCTKLGIHAARRREELTGVWVDDRKLASIGVGVRHWISMHGFAINVQGSLDPFKAIVPCGIPHVTMTSLEKETGDSNSPDVRGFAEHLSPVLHGQLRSIWNA